MGEKANSYKGYKLLIVIAYFCMAVLGIIGTLKGASIPSIRAEFSVDYQQIGTMLFMSLLGSLVSTFVGGMLIEKQGLRRIFLFGIGMSIVSSGLFYVMQSFSGVIIVHFILGLGYGSFQIGVNVLGGKIFVRNAATMMSLMHLFYGVGAAVAPRYAAAFISRGFSWKISYLGAIFLLFVLLVMVLLTKFPEASQAVRDTEITFRELSKSSKVWLIAITLGLFSIMEAGMADWLVNYLQEARALDIVSSTSYVTGFFIMFIVGRLVGDKLGYIKILFSFTLAAALIIFAGIILGDTYIMLFSVTGFFISICYPTMMVLIMQEYKNAVGPVMGFAITINGLIVMVGSRLIGTINEVWHVGTGMTSLGVCGLIAAGILLLLRKKLNHV